MAKTVIYIGHASISECNTVNGKKGDQTKKEVCIRTYYDKKWDYILRPKNKTLAEMTVQACINLCNNDCIGYSQNDRNSLDSELSKVNWNYHLLKTPCNTDCSAFMSVCAKIGGANIKYAKMANGKYNAPTTRTMVRAFKESGLYEVIKFTKMEDLLRGDVLVKEGSHTVMVLNSFTGVNVLKSNTEIAQEVTVGASESRLG